MNKLEFVSSIISSLTWPIASIIIVILLKKPLIRVLSNLNKLTYNNLEMDFSEKLDEIETSLVDHPVPENHEPIENSTQKDTDILEESDEQGEIQKQINSSILQRWPLEEKHEIILKIAPISPAAAISMSWSMVEEAIVNVVNKINIPREKPAWNTTVKNFRILQDYGKIDNNTLNSLYELKKLRNAAVHDSDFDKTTSYDEALKYHSLATQIIANLQK